MKVLFLDDMPYRHQVFRENNAGKDDVQYVWTGEKAVELMEKERFDVVYLDHDLAEVHYTEVNLAAEHTEIPKLRMSGTEVAQAIKEMAEEKRPRLAIIHSYNFAGRRRMQDRLNDVGMPNVTVIFNQHSGDPSVHQGLLDALDDEQENKFDLSDVELG